MSEPDEYERMRQRYRDSGYAGRVGFGRRPALVVVDLITAFTDARSPMSAPLEPQIEATNMLIERARRVGAPIVFATIAFQPDLSDAGVWIEKIPSNAWLTVGTEWVEVDDRLDRAEGDTIITRRAASCFFDTSLAADLTAAEVDTVLLAGCTTSGCVRATAVDSCSHGFRTVVVEEAVGDRAARAHKASLFDMDAKYADVLPLTDVLDHFDA